MQTVVEMLNERQLVAGQQNILEAVKHSDQ